MQTSTENVDSQNMTQDIALDLEKSAREQSTALYELNKKVNSWNMALNSKQVIKSQNDLETQEKKRRETSVKNLIGYEWKEARDGAKIEVVNPATSELIDTVPNVTEEDVDEENKERLSQLLTAETGNPIKEARGEIANVRIGVRAFIERAKHLYGESIPAGQEAGQEKTMQITKRYPIGVVAAIIPFNFPSDLFCQKVPPALLMGNSIIVKPSNYNPLTLIEYVKLMIEAGVPAGCIQILTGDGPKAGQALARHPGVHLVSLTGGTAAGIQTMGTCSQNLTHVMLELGGNDAFIFLEDGDMDLAVKETIWGRLYNGGQVCCASKRFLIHNSRKAEFIERMRQVIENLKVGDPTKEDTDMGPMININAAKRIEDQVNQMVAEGATVVCGGRREDAYYYPTILDNVTKDMEVSKDMEIFGPVISVIGFDTVDEAIEIANQSSYGLCGCVITKDYSLGMKIADRLECGGAIVNGASFYRSFEMPFGGWKHSGIGNEGVLTTLQEMSRIKTIILKNIL